MIQRIQSVYLLIATLLSGGLIFFLKLWVNEAGEDFFVINSFNTSSVLLQTMSVLFFSSALLTFVAIFQFNKRSLQISLGRLSILINFIILGIVVYFSQNLSGEINVSEKGIGLTIPILTILFVVIANNAIKKDEKLVKSVDRLR
jgi:membrane protease YdiL (CAAX protease family)